MLTGANCQIFRDGVRTLGHSLRVGDGLAICQPDVSERAIGRPKRASEEQKKALDPGNWRKSDRMSLIPSDYVAFLTSASLQPEMIALYLKLYCNCAEGASFSATQGF